MACTHKVIVETHHCNENENEIGKIISSIMENKVLPEDSVKDHMDFGDANYHYQLAPSGCDYRHMTLKWRCK